MVLYGPQPYRPDGTQAAYASFVLPYPLRPSLVLVPSPNLIMEPLPVRHLHPAIGGAARLQRLLAVMCASLNCADLVMASEIHGDETRYPTVTYADTDVSHTDVSRQVLRNLRIPPPFRPFLKG